MDRYTEELEQLIKFGDDHGGDIPVKKIKELIPDSEEDEDLYKEIVDYLTSIDLSIVTDEEAIEDFAEDENEDDESLEPNDEELENETSDLEKEEISVSDMDDIMNQTLQADDPVKMYFREIGQIKRLTQEEEYKYARDVQEMEMYKTKMEQYEKMGKTMSEEEMRMAQAAIERGMESREILIDSNLRLVIYVAKKHTNRGLQFLDLISVGNMGLIKAVKKFDPTRGWKFATYAHWWIKQSINRAIADLGRTIRIPVHMVDTINKLNRTTSRLTQEKKREPTIEEIAQAMDTTVEKVQKIQKIAQEPISIDQTVGEEDESSYGDIIADMDTQNPFEYAMDEEYRKTVDELLQGLTPREERVIRLRNGIDDNRVRTLEEVGSEFGFTRERSRQIENKALQRLKKNQAKLKDLKEFNNYYKSQR